MKTKTLLHALFVMVPFCMYAQSDYSNYLNKAMSKLEEGDCVTAQKFYNVYKELSRNTVSSFEVLLEDCHNDTAKTYVVGNVMMVKNEVYKVAYVQEGGKHGFAIREMGSGPLKPEYISQQKIPTWSEFLLIEENNSILKLDGKYWTPRSTYYVNRKDSPNLYYYYGLGSQSTKSSYSNYETPDKPHDLLFIHRF